MLVYPIIVDKLLFHCRCLEIPLPYHVGRFTHVAERGRGRGRNHATTGLLTLPILGKTMVIGTLEFRAWGMPYEFKVNL